MRHIGLPTISLKPLLWALLVSYGRRLWHMKLAAHKSLKPLPLTHKTTLTAPKSILWTTNITVNISNLREPANTPLVLGITSINLPKLGSTLCVIRKDVGHLTILRENKLS
jgi:hypothetical protein